jgi:chemotaxis protein CheY-P-specific phosphatase CheC
MTLKVTLCDDSKMARKQLLRTLPDDWDAEVHQAEHGEQALTCVREGRAEILFLDLNMPVKDGYETLQAIKDEQLETLVIVVSGDIQPEAQKRVQSLGAMAFVKKPMKAEDVQTLLQQFGLYQPAGGQLKVADQQTQAPSNPLDVYREVSNVAMGQAGDHLARVLDTFIELPVPNVNFIAPSELHMAIESIDAKQQVAAVSQGFSGSGILGEALTLFNEAAIDDIGQLLGAKLGESGSVKQQRIESLMDVASILSSACLNGLGQQLHVEFAASQPVLLGENQSMQELLQHGEQRWQKILAIEIGYQLPEHKLAFDLLLLFPADAVKILDQQLAHWLQSEEDDQ